MESNHVIWLQTAFLGDLVLNTGGFKLLSELRPGVKQYLLTTPQGYDLFKDSPWFADVFYLRKRGLAFWQDLRFVQARLSKLQANNTFLLRNHGSYRSAIIAKYLGFPCIGYREQKLSFLFKLRHTRVASFHEVVRQALLLEGLGIPREQIVEAVPTLPWQKTYGPTRPQSQALIGIPPGSVWATKCWPYHDDLILALHRSQPNRRFVLLGGKTEVERGKEIMDKVLSQEPRVNLDNLINTTNLAELSRIISSLSLVVCHDSGPMHIASAHDVPIVTIFGPTVRGFGFYPIASKYRLVENPDLPCRPCHHHGPRTCPESHFRCMRDVSVAQVQQACESLLQT